MQIVRRCCYCEIEFGLIPPDDASHGICRRHAIEQYKELDMLTEKTQKRIFDAPAHEFCFDMGQVFDG